MPACEVGMMWRPTQDLDPVEEYDYISFWQADLWGPAPLFRIDEDGTACLTAEDLAVCEATVAEPPASGFRIIRTTDRRGVADRASADEVAGLLGPVNTPQEALIVVWHAGYDVYCGDVDNVAVREVGDGYEVYATRITSDCPVSVSRYHLHVSADGTVTVLGEEVIEMSGGCIGRRPEGLVTTGPERTASLPGEWLAEVAHLEASAVDAFRVLADELRMHGAPGELVDAALRAADDEVRHAEQMTDLARRFGGEPKPAEVESRPPRDLWAMALDNAVEGQVRETFGAMIGTYQSLAAADPRLQSTMCGIAADETRHAGLSWKIAEWIEPLLTETQRRELVRARAEAVARLRAEMQAPVDEELMRAAGLPSPAQAVGLVDALAATLWS
jgi:hypothetical protein